MLSAEVGAGTGVGVAVEVGVAERVGADTGVDVAVEVGVGGSLEHATPSIVSSPSRPRVKYWTNREIRWGLR